MKKRIINGKVICLIALLTVFVLLTGCSSSNNSNGNSSAHKVGKSDSRVIVYSSDKVTGEPITIEEIAMEPFLFGDGRWFRLTVKIRNTSGKEISGEHGTIRIWYQYLDENMDILYDSYFSEGYGATIKDGQSVKYDSQGSSPRWDKDEMDEAKYINIYKYATTTYIEDAVEFNDPILLEIVK